MFAGFVILISGLSESEAAIYGGPATGTPSNPQPGSAPVGGATPTATDAARANALQAMARTNQAVGAARALQDAARAAAATNNLGQNPNNPSQTLPNVADGLAPGGLQIAPGVSTNPNLWQGAELPTEAINNGLTNVTVRQTAQQALLEWQTFNVGRNTTLTFDQSAAGGSAAQWIAFNKVSDPTANPTQILGQIKAQGQVYIINPNGIIFGGSSQVNVNTLTASALPINSNLVARGLLNNPDQQFLFSALAIPAGTDGTPAFNPNLPANTKLGDVTVQAGAKISTPVSADGNGGRILLVGANVTNNGTLSTPAGQTILAAGLQVGVNAHNSADPSLRGLDVYVGAVTDPASALTPYAGTATNNGIIEIARASAIITGKSVNQNGIVESSTSVALNGRVDLLANYDAISNPAYDPSQASTGTPFLFRSSGTVTLGENSVTRILPEVESLATTTGTELALRSQINLQGRNIHFAPGSIILAPNAIANVKAGSWNFIADSSNPSSTFITSTGQVYLAEDSLINLAGTADATASVTQNLLTLELRGSELAVAPIQREGELRGDTITVDMSRTGTYEGRFWVGTPLADLTGYVGLVQRNVGQLTTAGGTLNISAGGSVVIQQGSTVDVSGGWTNFTGGRVSTTQVISGGRLVDIADALPNETYSGIFSPTITIRNESWGVEKIFNIGLMPSGPRFQPRFTQGADGGNLNITAPGMALDGKLVGNTVAGEYQIRNNSGTSSLPKAASLNLRFEAQRIDGTSIFTHYPTAPDIVFTDDGQAQAVGDFQTDSAGNATSLPQDRLSTVHLSPDLLTTGGFGNLTLSNPEGSILIPENVKLATSPGGSITLTSSRIEVRGDVSATGGSLSFNIHNISPYLAAQQTASGAPTQLPLTPGLGVFILADGASLSTAGSITDDRFPEFGNVAALPDAGSISIQANSVTLESNSIIDVSGGYAMTSKGTGRFGNGGSISIKSGQDLAQPSAIGGNLSLDGSLIGYSGAKGGSLSLQATTVQIGGNPAAAGTLHLQPEFFNQGGFGSFTLTGLVPSAGNPAVWVAPGTIVAPVVKSLALAPDLTNNQPASLQIVENPSGLRQGVNITLSAPGARDVTNGLVSRGDVLVDEGAIIRTEAGGSFKATGNTVSILGSIITPGGNITIGGGGVTASVFQDPNRALVTTYIGANAHLSAAGTTVLVPDPFGRRAGTVLSGGNITLTGNIAAEAGAILDVSGASGILDLDPGNGQAVANATALPGNVLNRPIQSLAAVPTRIDSNGGTISLQGSEVLASDATLIANAGGSTALGGKLVVSSGRFDPSSVIPPASAITLTVSQSGSLLGGSAGIGSEIGSAGRFVVDSFSSGGFDSLELGGVVSFSGPVNIGARGEVSLANSGFVRADSAVNINANYVSFGKQDIIPDLPEEVRNPLSENSRPTHGSGSLNISAGLIDVGSLSALNIGNITLTANNGDIRGSGTLHVAGDLTLRAGQIYPHQANSLSFIAYDYTGGQGTINIEAAGNRRLPLSAGGTLGIYASVIHQNGTLRAPFGTINLGWDGTGTAPVDLIAGNTAPFPVTSQLTLGSGSVTSVSAIDPLTGKALVLPYGVSTDGEDWIDPRGVDITTSGPPQKAINLSAANLTTSDGSTIDLRGGGNLFAYRFVSGLGGITDILASGSSFAVLPDNSSIYAPAGAYNTSGNEANLIAPYGAGYVNPSLKVGDRVYLAASASLPAGYYTLLPARYALLPGAVLVTPSAGSSGLGTVEMPDHSSIVSGYRYNSLNGERTLPTLSTRFEVAKADVFRSRAQYDVFLANAFLASRAQALNTITPLLPQDSGQLLFQASQSLTLDGSVISVPAGQGRGSLIDISTNLDTYIGNGLASVPGSITLDAATLSSFDAESLLIGGKRTRGENGTTVQVNSGNLTVDNAGHLLSANDLVLVAKNSLTLAAGAELASTGSATSGAETLQLSGNGALVRVSANPNAKTIRTGVTTATAPVLSIGNDARLSGGSLVLDSSATLSLSENAHLTASSYSLSSGRISLLLDNPGALLPNPGLVLGNQALQDFQSASSLSLVSYSSIDLYGSGQLGGDYLANLTLSAGELRGLNQGSGTTQLSARNLTLSNIGNATVGAAGTSTGSLVLNAGTLTLGSNQIAINRYSDVTLRATNGITGQGTGGLSTSGNLSLVAPLITGEAGAIRTITAGGKLSLVSSPGTTTQVTPGLGSRLTLTGTSVSANTRVHLPSGSLTIHATTGNVTVGGLLDVSGTARQFGNQIKYTNAGIIDLSASQGDVILESQGTLNLAAQSAGGDAGVLSISNPAGTFVSAGSILASGGSGGENGSFLLDTASLPTFSGLAGTLADASLKQSQIIRVRSGDVTIDGTAIAREFRLAADQGSITLTGKIDASGTTGGSVYLSANRDLTLQAGATITVAGQNFSTSGKGGDVTLEAGSQTNGVVGNGTLDLRAGSTIDLSVASKIAGNASTQGTSAYKGQFSGKLHLRAPQAAGFTDLRVNAINASIVDASSIVVEGYRTYDLTSSGGAITTAVQNQIKADATAYLGAAGSTSANYSSILGRLLGGNTSLEPLLVLAPGVEIINRTGDLTLGTSSSSSVSDWDLSGFRFGAKSAAGVLTLRAAGNLVFHNTLSDGFTPSLTSDSPTWLWLAPLTTQKALLPINTQSWEYRLTAGADLSSSSYTETKSLDSLAANTGSLVLGKPGVNTVTGGNGAFTSSIIGTHYQVIRTGSGDIDINAGRNIQLLNQLATIYTAGTRVADPNLGGTFDLPLLSNQNGGSSFLGEPQQTFSASFSMAGGDVTLHAGQNIEHLTRTSGQLVADSQFQLPSNWLYRRGFVNPATGQFGVGRFNDSGSTAWWVNFSNFFQGIGALGGGDVTLIAGNDISNVDAVAPTNARMAKGTPDASKLLELGGGNLLVQSGNNIDAGVYYVERGEGILTAGNQIITNATRSVLTQNNIGAGLSSAYNQLPTTLFLGKGSFDVSANSDLLLGPIANTFLLPQGIGNSFWYKTYFSTYGEDSEVNVTSLGGDVTLRTSSTLPGQTNGTAQHLLQNWITNKLLLSNTSASFQKPWLRLSESSASPFATILTLMPGTLRTTALSGDINLVGNLTLSPSAHGTLEFLSSGSINALQPNGIVSPNGVRSTSWGTSRVIVSDADPGAIPGITSPLAYQTFVGTSSETAAAFTNASLNYLESFNRLFRESGGTVGLVLETKQSLHDSSLLHRDDDSPLLLYAGGGDISGLTLFSPKAANIFAGRDIADVAFYIQNLSATDTSVVAAGRNILPYSTSSLLRVDATGTGNVLNVNAGPLAGDIQIAGQGSLQVIAGGNIDLGTGANNADGTGSGITSIGNTRNPYLSAQGANLLVAAGVATTSGLADSALHLGEFIELYVTTEKGREYLKEISPDLVFENLNSEEQARVAMEVFHFILRDAGRAYQETGNYDSALAAIEVLFGALEEGELPPPGNILTRARDIRTTQGGNIDILTPDGGLTLANSTFGNTLSPPGIITEAGGDISIFARNDISIGIGRIFTLRGGDEILWSSEGNIAAGSSSKTVQSAPPTRVIIDPQSAAIQTDLAGLATGGGIGVLASVAGVKPGNVDLIAPKGFVDAGDAGIRSAGNLNIAANQVLNAGNISTGGTSTGTPATVSAPVAVNTVSNATNAAAAAANPTPPATNEAPANTEVTPVDTSSTISVEVIGYGGDTGEEEDEEKKKQNKTQQEQDAGNPQSGGAQ